MMSSEARLVTRDNAIAIAKWCGGYVVAQYDALDSNVSTPGINVPVGDHVERAQLGDVIIRKHDGTFEIFKDHQ